MEVTIEEFKPLSEGEHEGIIADVVYREATKGTQSFQYVDLPIKVDDTELTINYGMPFKEIVTPNSKLGQFLERTGHKIGQKINMESFKGKRVKIFTENTKTSEGMIFANIKSITVL